MRLSFLILFCIAFATQSFAQSKFTYGGMVSLDFNAYKDFDGKSGDVGNNGSLSLGFSIGGSFDYKIADQLYLNSNPVFSRKQYFPNRKFRFGTLTRVKLNTVDVPLNLKYDVNQFFYVFGGVTTQYEGEVRAIYEFENGFDESSNFLEAGGIYAFPNLGLGVKANVDKATVKVQLNYRFLKNDNQYLNSAIDKIGFGIIISKK